MSDFPVPSPSTTSPLFQTVRATIVDAATGNVLRYVECPRLALKMQAATGETLVERVIARGKRWDAATETEVDAPQPPAPADAVEFDAAAWRWVTKTERNRPLIRRMEFLEVAQSRAVREFMLGDMTQLEMRAKLRLIDNAIAEIRAQLLA